MPLIKADYILLILNCKKYIYKASKQKETWLKNFTLMPYFHVIGDIELTTNYMFDRENNILYVKTEDDYNSLPQKVISAFIAVSLEYKFEYIFKTDDDQMLQIEHFLPSIQSILKKKTPKVHYGGNIIKVAKPYLSQYHKIHPELPHNLPVLATTYCNGRFYLLSALAIQQLITKSKCICREYLEDYAIGLNLDPVLKKNTLFIDSNKYFCDFT